MTTAPTLGSIPLFLVGKACSGAAFELTRPARSSDTVQVDGWEVEVAKGSTVVVARGGADESHDEAFLNGLIRAQKGLDLTCCQGCQ